MPAATLPGIGHGTTVWLHNGTALTQLAKVKDVKIPQTEIDELEVTHYQSANRTREYVAGLKTLQDVEVELFYVPGSATDILCRAARDVADNRAVRIIVPNETGAGAVQFDFPAFVKTYAPTNEVDGVRMATLTLKPAAATTETNL
jgi:predicted secreted protein